MAYIFLSYVHEDQQRARLIAAVLERAGHSVWWDRRIKGGERFSAEIEAALEKAEKVVVLWSAHSVRSAWVCDEAAVGRDSGGLVPVTMDGTPPPLGFRQFQTIDLSRWNGRGKPPALSELLETVGSPHDRASESVARPGGILWPRVPKGLPWIITSLIVVGIAVAGAAWWDSRASARPPTVAIESTDGSAVSRKVARQLSVRLGQVQSVSGDVFQFIPGSGSADLVLEVQASDDETSLRRDLSVVSGRDRSLLWSTSLQQPPSKANDLSQQLTLTSGRVLSCALEALTDRRDRIDSLTLKQYLNGCSRLEDVYGLGQYEPALANMFEQVVAKAPHFEGAWAKLLTTESEAARNPDPSRVLVDKLRAHIEQAQSLGLKIGEIYAARAALLPGSDFVGIFAILEQGLQADPDNSLIFRLHGEEAQRVGRMSDASYDAYQALRLDPGSPALQDNVISTLAYAGKIDAAYAQLRKAEAIWPGASNIQMARYRLDLRFGDPKEALALLQGNNSTMVDPAQQSFIQARINPTPANIQHAIDEERVQFGQEPRYIGGLLQVLGQFHRIEEAIDVMLHYTRPDAIGFNAEVMFRPAMRDVWRDPRSMAGAAHVGFLRYWEKTGRWPDFCAEPDLPYDCKKEAAKYRV